MKVIFLTDFNGWGKGSVARFVNEMAQDYIDKGYCQLADDAAPELRLPVTEVIVPTVTDTTIEEKTEEPKKSFFNKIL